MYIHSQGSSPVINLFVLLAAIFIDVLEKGILTNKSTIKCNAINKKCRRCFIICKGNTDRQLEQFLIFSDQNHPRIFTCEKQT